MNQNKPKLWVTVGAFALLVFVLAACSQSPQSASITIEDAWGRPSPMVASSGAFYMVILNEGQEDDQLVVASSAACGTVELHEAYLTEQGAMGMRPVTGGRIAIPAGGQVELKPGGLHIMCIDKQVEFEIGAVLPLSLEFEQSGAIELEIEIREP